MFLRLDVRRDFSTASDKKDDSTIKNEEESVQGINDSAVEENEEITRLNDALSDMKVPLFAIYSIHFCCIGRLQLLDDSALYVCIK